MFKRGPIRATLGLLAVVVLGVSYYWSIWDQEDTVAWVRYVWLAFGGVILSLQISTRTASLLQRACITALPILCVGSILVDVGTTAMFWPRMERWHAQKVDLVEEMLSPPSKLSLNWSVYVELKRRAGNSPIILARPESFARFVPEMLELNLTLNPAFDDVLSQSERLRLEAMSSHTYHSIRSYLPVEIKSEYILLAAERPETYFVLRSSDEHFWIVPQSLLRLVRDKV